MDQLRIEVILGSDAWKKAERCEFNLDKTKFSSFVESVAHDSSVKPSLGNGSEGGQGTIELSNRG
jgi:hypothetical protein